MGNSISVENEQPDIWWSPFNMYVADTEQTAATKICISTQTDLNVISETIYSQNATSSSITNEENKENNEIKMQQFKSDLEKKHLARREAIAERSREILFLREELIKYKKENEQLKDIMKQNNELNEIMTEEQNIEEVKIELEQFKHENEKLQYKITQLNKEMNRTDEITKQNQDLRKSIAKTQKDLQSVNAQVVEFEKERHEYESHVVALKDVINVSKRLLEIRENQLRELKSKVNDIETSLAEREVAMMSQNLKDEYERQLENIRNLRALYEQRQAATKAERDLMASKLTDAKNILQNEQKKNGELQERIGELESNVSDKYDEIKSLESQLGLAKAEFRGLESEMSAINQLFSQIIYGFNNCEEIDFDKLIKLLKENHDLLTNIVINEESEAISSALPKVLLDLVNQVNIENKIANTIEESEESTSNLCNGTDVVLEENQPSEQQCVNTINSAEEIVNKLPKVWRVLTELLRQQSGQLPVDIQDGTDPCYKSIETPKGPKLVLSVSQTFIRLKDLILEKKSLEKEMSRLKQLNTHLEVRLQDQEKRLETVSSELSKTWHVVGRMQRQHQQLHTHEKILRYELAQKRKMLTELKEELEYCREKWEQAREKNSNTEEAWKKLRTEFAARKTVVADELNNSAESGYSDERECSSDEEYNNDRRNKKLINKIPVSEQISDTDDTEETNTTKIDDTVIKIDNAENVTTINNQGEVNTQIIEESEKSDECDEKIHSTVEQKTDFDVQNQTEKTVPATLDMIDTVCALGIVPVTVSDTIYSNSDQIPSTSSEISPTDREISQDKILQVQNLTEKTAPASLDMIDTVCALGIVPVTVSDTIYLNSDQTPSTSSEISPIDREISQDEILQVQNQTEKTAPASLDMIDTVCALGIVPVIVSDPTNLYTYQTPSTSSEITPTEREISQDERLKRKEERLKRLEEQCQQLVTKVTNTTNRSTEIYNRLETLHEQYGNDSTRNNEEASENAENNSE